MFSIIIPAYNKADKLKILLDSIYRSKIDNCFEVIVVDDASPSEEIVKLSGEYSNFRVIRLNENVGSAEARNVGARAAIYDILIFFDHDVVLEDNTLKKIEDAFVVYNKDIIVGEYSKVPANPGFFPRFKALLAYWWSPIGMKETTIFAPRVSAIKKDIFFKTDGFDKKVYYSVEDYEYGHRLISHGYKIEYDDSIIVKHHWPETVHVQFPLFFKRAEKWISLFIKRKKFENLAATPELGISYLLAFISFYLILMTFFIGKLFWGISVFIIYILFSIRFYSMVYKEEGLLFSIKSIITNIYLSHAIVFGTLKGIANYFLRNKKAF